ncbi:hypothetical protein DFP73DRAFT_599637 [Morchella snyderi]|nr:hypothetical protein DFP73DRAFT_599637 [Morchella snyderi]
MRRRGVLDRIPQIQMSARQRRRLNSQATTSSNLSDSIQILEDIIAEETVAAVENDVDPERDEPIRQTFQDLSINLLGVNYNTGAAEEEDDGSKDPIPVLDDDNNVDAAPENHMPDAPPIIQLPEPRDIHMQLEETIADGPSKERDVRIDDFHMALMLFTTTADLSRTQYQALVEVLSIATLEGIRTLPKSLKTLRERCRSSFPLLHIKSRPIDINLEATPPKTDTPGTAYYFDISEYCRMWLSNPKMVLHQGFGELVDHPSELWHGDLWMESVRSTSGRYAQLEGGVPLLPSDCVNYVDGSGLHAIGHIKCIALDRRGKANEGVLSAVVHRLVPRENIIPQINEVLATSCDIAHENGAIYPLYNSDLPELVLFEIRETIPITSIISRAWVYFTDYESPESLRESLLPINPTFCVKRIVYFANSMIKWRPIWKRHRIAAESELIHLTRDAVISSFAQHRCISVPFSVFLDGFGLYRNAYHSLKGMYVTPAGLSVDKRTSLSNMYVLMIGPFGTHELNMAACIEKDSLSMGAGRLMTLESGSEPVFITAFPLLFTGDMPQQNQNSGNKTHNAEFGCRSCFVRDKNRGDLGLDTAMFGRYKAPTESLYNESIGLRTKKAKTDALQRYGLTAEGPYFKRCYPMMDPHRACPNDPFHAELRLCKYYSEALIDGLLSPTGISAYRDAWNTVNVPYRWGQPQNPVNHKGSMVFSEHGKMAIMNPFVLMIIFSGSTARSIFKAGVEERIKRSFSDDKEPKYQVLHTAFLLAKVVHMTLKRCIDHRPHESFVSVILDMRNMLRRFFGATISTKGGFQKYADVPNVHLALHYATDIENFASTFNATTMLGEQKHKVFKMHAQHTNSHENDLQLLKLINTLQTVRFALDDTFAVSSPALTTQLNSIVNRCPVLKQKRIVLTTIIGQHRSSNST